MNDWNVKPEHCICGNNTVFPSDSHYPGQQGMSHKLQTTWERDTVSFITSVRGSHGSHLQNKHSEHDNLLWLTLFFID